MLAANRSSRELKPFNAPFLSTDDPRFFMAKKSIFKIFEDWLKSIEERPGAYTNLRTENVYIITNI